MLLSAQHLIVILAAFLACAGWIAAAVTNRNREQQPIGEVYAWAAFLAALFVVLAIAGVRYLAPAIVPLLRQ